MDGLRRDVFRVGLLLANWHHPGRNEILLDIGDQADPHNTPLLPTTYLI